MRPLLLAVLLAAAPCASAQITPSCTFDTLFATDGTSQDWLGASVDTQDDWIVAGAWGDDPAGTESGSVYVFRRDPATGTWTQTQKLAPSVHSASDRFGVRVDIDADLLAVGGAGDSIVGTPGSVWLFRLNAGSNQWVEEAAIPPPPGSSYGFGAMASVSDGVLFVGDLATPNSVGGHGVVHVFERTGGVWGLAQTIVPPTSLPFEGFGGTLDVDGDTLVVRGGANQQVPAVHVFDRDASGQFVHTTELVGGNASSADGFGTQIVDGGTIAVSFRTNQPGHGRVSVYELDALAGSWSLRDTFAGPQQSEGTFGRALHLRDGWLLVGQPSTQRAYGYLRVPATARWQLAARLEGAPAPYWTGFGLALASQDGRAAIGVSSGFGLARWTGTVEVVDLAGCNSLGAAYCGPALPNSSGQSAGIAASGRATAVASALHLTADGMPAMQFGYFLASRNAALVMPPGSQGNLCLGGPTGRFRRPGELRSTGLVGRFSLTVDTSSIPLTPPVGIQPGETWRFQAWFRDSNPTPTSNFSDALAVAFL